MPTTAEINAIIKSHSVSEVDRLIDEHIFDERIREIAKMKLLRGKTYETVSERFNLTPRQCFNIVKTVRQTIVQYIDT